MPDTMSLLNSVGVNTSLYPPVFVATQSAGTNITSGFGGAAMVLTTPTVDSYGGWSAGTPSRYTPTSPGWYLFSGIVGFPTNTTGTRITQLQKNGSSANSMASGGQAMSTVSFNLPIQATGILFMNGTTDYIEVWGYQDSGSTLTSVPSSTFLMALRVHL